MGIAQTFIFPGALATNEGKVSIAAHVLQAATMQVGDIGHRIVEIHFLRAAGAGDIFEIIPAAHAEGIVKDVGEFEGEISRVKCPQARARHPQPYIVAVAIKTNRRHQVIDDEILVIGVAHSPPVGISPLVEPCLSIQSLRTIHFHFAGINELGDGPDHPVVLKIVELATTRGEGDHRSAIMTEGEHLHLAPNGRAVHSFVSSEHHGPGFRWKLKQ